MAKAAQDKKFKKALEGYQWDDLIAALKKGANPNLKHKDEYALPKACWYLELDAVRELLAHGANVNINKGEAIERVASSTNRGDAKAILQLLVDAGANLELPSPRHFGSTPVSVAIMTGHPQLAEVLVKAGANLKVKNTDGETPIDVAKTWGHKKLLELMTGKKPKKGAAIDPFIEVAFVGQLVKGKAKGPHASGLPWKNVYKGKFPGCANPPIHLLTLDLSTVEEFPESIRKLGKVPIVSHSCECDERDYHEFAIDRSGKLSDTDKDWPERNECAPDDYRPTKKTSYFTLVREAKGVLGDGVVVGGQPHWAQQPIWPSCPKCDEAGFFIAALYQYELPPGAEGRGNHLNVFVCGKCRTQCMIRQST